MEKWRNAIKCEKILLLVTGVFLCLLLALFFRDRAAMAASPVEPETAVPQADFMPDVSPVNVNTAAAEELTKLPGVGTRCPGVLWTTGQSTAPLKGRRTCWAYPASGRRSWRSWRGGSPLKMSNTEGRTA